uniref:DUF4456 domain-containing protein n=1 Tax=Caenorhabditis tropicalis TaxID=1561998 RepID=A0A1I7TGC4_9PELO
MVPDADQKEDEIPSKDAPEAREPSDVHEQMEIQDVDGEAEKSKAFEILTHKAAKRVSFDPINVTDSVEQQRAINVLMESSRILIKDTTRISAIDWTRSSTYYKRKVNEYSTSIRKMCEWNSIMEKKIKQHQKNDELIKLQNEILVLIASGRQQILEMEQLKTFLNDSEFFFIRNRSLMSEMEETQWSVLRKKDVPLIKMIREKITDGLKEQMECISRIKDTETMLKGDPHPAIGRIGDTVKTAETNLVHVKRLRTCFENHAVELTRTCLKYRGNELKGDVEAQALTVVDGVALKLMEKESVRVLSIDNPLEWIVKKSDGTTGKVKSIYLQRLKPEGRKRSLDLLKNKREKKKRFEAPIVRVDYTPTLQTPCQRKHKTLRQI